MANQFFLRSLQRQVDTPSAQERYRPASDRIFRRYLPKSGQTHYPRRVFGRSLPAKRQYLDTDEFFVSYENSLAAAAKAHASCCPARGLAPTLHLNKRSFDEFSGVEHSTDACARQMVPCNSARDCWSWSDFKGVPRHNRTCDYCNCSLDCDDKVCHPPTASVPDIEDLCNRFDTFSCGNTNIPICGLCVLPPPTSLLRLVAEENGSHGEWSESDDVRRVKARRARANVGRTMRIIADAALPNTGAGQALQIAGLLARDVKRGFIKKKPKAPTKVVARPPRMLSLSGTSLSRSASRYLRCILDPFSIREPVCIPSFPCVPSLKVMSYLRGTGHIGTAGVGFVAMAPSVINDFASLYVTASAYAQTVTAGLPSDAAAGGTAFSPVGVSFSNLPYNSGQVVHNNIASSIAGRIVSAGLRMVYTGKLIDKSGNYYALSDPDSDSVIGNAHTSGTPGTGYSSSTLSAKASTEIMTVNEKSRGAMIVHVPTDNHQVNYPDALASNTVRWWPYSQGVSYTYHTGTQLGQATELIMIEGVAGSTFYYEAVLHVEYIGGGVAQTLLTPNESDSVGMEIVQCVCANAQRAVAGDSRLTLAQAIQLEMRRERVVFGSGPRSSTR